MVWYAVSYKDIQKGCFWVFLGVFSPLLCKENSKCKCDTPLLFSLLPSPLLFLLLLCLFNKHILSSNSFGSSAIWSSKIKGRYLDSKRALVRLQKGTYCKSIRHLLEAKRACIGFDAHENNLQTSVDKGTSGIWSDTVCHLRLGFWRNVTRRHGEYGGISKHWQSQRHRRCIEQRRLFAHFFGSFEIWSDRLKLLYNRHTESRRERR